MSSKVLYFRGTPLTTLWNPKVQQFRRLSSKTTNCCSLQPPNVSHLAKTAHISLTPTEVILSSFFFFFIINIPFFVFPFQIMIVIYLISG
jgi:hypothetical protein